MQAVSRCTLRARNTVMRRPRDKSSGNFLGLVLVSWNAGVTPEPLRKEAPSPPLDRHPAVTRRLQVAICLEIRA
ncbi:hypothetical protein D3C87_1103860 [compost metagenome]